MLKWLICLIPAACLPASTFWQDPVQIVSVPTNSFIETLVSAMNSRGDAIMLWGTDSFVNSGGTFSSYRLSSETTWSAPLTLSTVGPATQTYKPIDVVLDNSGIASIVFVFNNSIGLSRLSLGGTWDTPVFFSPLGTMVSIPDAHITLDSNQVPIAFFTQAANVYYTSYISGSWQTPVLLASDAVSGYPSNISGSPGGDVVGVWQMNDMMGHSLYEFSTRINGVWSTPESIASYFSFPFVAPKIIGGPINRFLFQAFEITSFGPTSFALDVAESVNPQMTADWIKTTLGVISSSDTNQTMDISMNSTGQALSFWSQTDMTSTTLLSNYWPPNSTTPNTQLSITNGTSIGNLRGVIEKNGTGIAVWVHNSSIESSNDLNGGVWTTPEDISLANPITNSLNSISTSKGKSASFVFWIENDGVNNNILSRKHPIRSEPSPPLGGQGKNLFNRFVTQGYLLNQFSWSASEDPDVGSYDIYADSELTQLLGNVLATSDLSFTTGVVSPYTSHSYFVVAIIDGSDPSTPLTITIPAYK